MKKMLSILLALLVLLGAAFALAQDNTQGEAENVLEIDGAEYEEIVPVAELSGVITEISEDYVMLLVPMLGEVQANVIEDTVIEGVEELNIGQTAVVLYDGMMTRSLPPQITALQIGVYAVEGEIVEILRESGESGESGEDGAEDSCTVLLARADTGEEVILTLTGEAQQLPLAVGDEVIAYTTGVATLSLPPQMNALAIMYAQDAVQDAVSEATPAEATPAEAESENG